MMVVGRILGANIAEMSTVFASPMDAVSLGQSIKKRSWCTLQWRQGTLFRSV